jgi:transposase-like protein
MTLPELNALYSTEERCREYLKRLRWPEGVTCPRCQAKRIATLTTNYKFECLDCSYQFTALAGTVFHDTHLSLEKWFMAVLLMCESRKGISANNMKRVLGVSYKTAWYLCHRIRHAMTETDRPKLDGVVELDETYLGSKKRRFSAQRKRGRGAEGKQIVFGIRERGGDLRFIHVKDITAKTIRDTVLAHVSPDAELIITDELPVYLGALKPFKGRHERIKHKDTYVDGTIHTNTVESAFSLFKRGVVGTWHKISAKHLQAYLDEMTFRFDRRKSPDLFVQTLKKLVTTTNLTFERLTA